MKRSLLFLVFVFVFATTQAQTIKSAFVKLSSDGRDIRFMELTLDNGFVFGIKDCRELLYVMQGDSRVQSLFAAGIDLKYYDRFDIHDPQGKIKSIGNLVFKYNNVFDIHEIFGTLRVLGDIEIKYYNVFDREDLRGSVKTVGNLEVSYYSNSGPAGRNREIRSITDGSDELTVVGLSRWDR